MNTLYIKIFKEADIEKGEVFFSKNLLNEILTLDKNLEGNNSYENGVCFFAKGEQNEQKCVGLKNLVTICADGVMRIKFEKTKEMDINSGEMKKRLKRELVKIGKIKSNDYIPNCFVLSQFNPANNKIDITEKLRELINQKKWNEIYQMMGDLDKIKKSEYWDDSETLDMISFAYSKLSNASSLPSLLKKDKVRYEQELKLRKKFRNTEVDLRKRCIDLYPENSAYYANLAYFHYNACIELKNRYRKDGNITHHIHEAKENFKTSLERDPSRVKEYYRYGRLKVEFESENILFANKSESFSERFKNSEKAVKEGIEILEKGISIYEENPKTSIEYKRFRKEYIKSFYTISNGYFSLIKNVWDVSFIISNEIIRDSQFYKINDDIELLNKSISVFIRGCQEDCNKPDIQDIIDLLRFEGELNARNKYYTLGKYYTALAFIFYKLKNSEELNKALSYSEIYLNKALNIKSTESGTYEPKGHIYERICRYFILSDKPEGAVKIYEKNYEFKKKLKPYEAYTVFIAYYLIGETEKGKEVLNSQIESKANLDKLSGYFLIGTAEMEKGNYEKAEENFKKCIEIAKERGIKSLDSVFISMAHCANRKGEKEKADKYLEEALAINPRRVNALKRKLDWY